MHAVEIGGAPLHRPAIAGQSDFRPELLELRPPLVERQLAVLQADPPGVAAGMRQSGRHQVRLHVVQHDRQAIRRLLEPLGLAGQMFVRVEEPDLVNLAP